MYKAQEMTLKAAIIIVISVGIFSFLYRGNISLTTDHSPHSNFSGEGRSLNTMLLTSPSFHDNEPIPQKFTCDGGDINPELHIQNVPENTKSLALIMDDPDAPGRTFIHWLVWNIDPKTTMIKQESRPPGSIEGKTDFGRIGYGGPCPPPGKPHRYFFKLYALDAILNLSEGSGKGELEKEIKEHLVTQTELIGIYERK